MRKFRRNSGFTLLEIIIVIAIMGFLVAMIAPRLGGIGQDAQENVDNTNLQRLTDTIGYGVQQNSLLPNNLVNLVTTADGIAYKIPAVTGTAATIDDPETFNDNLVDENHLTIHVLSAKEAKALNDMGLTKVLLLSDGV